MVGDNDKAANDNGKTPRKKRSGRQRAEPAAGQSEPTTEERPTPTDTDTGAEDAMAPGTAAESVPPPSTEAAAPVPDDSATGGASVDECEKAAEEVPEIERPQESGVAEQVTDVPEQAAVEVQAEAEPTPPREVPAPKQRAKDHPKGGKKKNRDHQKDREHKDMDAVKMETVVPMIGEGEEVVKANGVIEVAKAAPVEEAATHMTTSAAQHDEPPAREDKGGEKASSTDPSHLPLRMAVGRSDSVLSTAGSTLHGSTTASCSCDHLASPTAAATHNASESTTLPSHTRADGENSPSPKSRRDPPSTPSDTGTPVPQQPSLYWQPTSNPSSSSTRDRAPYTYSGSVPSTGTGSTRSACSTDSAGSGGSRLMMGSYSYSTGINGTTGTVGPAGKQGGAMEGQPGGREGGKRGQGSRNREAETAASRPTPSEQPVTADTATPATSPNASEAKPAPNDAQQAEETAASNDQLSCRSEPSSAAVRQGHRKGDHDKRQEESFGDHESVPEPASAAHASTRAAAAGLSCGVEEPGGCEGGHQCAASDGGQGHPPFREVSLLPPSPLPDDLPPSPIPIPHSSSLSSIDSHSHKTAGGGLLPRPDTCQPSPALSMTAIPFPSYSSAQGPQSTQQRPLLLLQRPSNAQRHHIPLPRLGNPSLDQSDAASQTSTGDAMPSARSSVDQGGGTGSHAPFPHHDSSPLLRSNSLSELARSETDPANSTSSTNGNSTTTTNGIICYPSPKAAHSHTRAMTSGVLGAAPSRPAAPVHRGHTWMKGQINAPLLATPTKVPPFPQFDQGAANVPSSLDRRPVAPRAEDATSSTNRPKPGGVVQSNLSSASAPFYPRGMKPRGTATSFMDVNIASVLKKGYPSQPSSPHTQSVSLPRPPIPMPSNRGLGLGVGVGVGGVGLGRGVGGVGGPGDFNLGAFLDCTTPHASPLQVRLRVRVCGLGGLEGHTAQHSTS